MQEIESLFEEAARELEKDQMNAGFEISSEQFVSDRESEEIKLLFNLARLNLEDPSHDYTEGKLITSDLRKVSAEDLEKVLTATEEAIDAPAIRLNAVRPEGSKRISALISERVSPQADIFISRAKKITAPQPGQRLGAIIADLFLSILVASVLSATLLYILKGHFPAVDTLSPPLVDLLPYFSLLLTSVAIGGILYETTSFLLTGTTAGLAAFGLRVVTNDGAKPAKKQLLLRALLIPLSVFTLSFLMALFFNREALHGTASRTRTVR